jgi:hypothetical protein
MEEEINYLYEKIEEVDRSISGCSFAVEIAVSTNEELQDLKVELQMLTNILDKLTEIELT